MKKNNRRLNINFDDLFSKRNKDPPPELVLLPRRTNEHQHQQSSSGPEQMTDLELSQAIIRARNQLKSIAPRLPDRGAKFKANLKLMENELNRRNSIREQNQNQKAKISRTNGSPELDSVACGTPPELVLLPRRTNEHQLQQSSSDPEQMTDLELSQTIIRVRNQLKSIAPRLPDKGARFKANLKLMEDEQNRRNSIRVQNQKHRKAKISRTNGSPELDTVACGTLEASHSHDLSSTDENDVDVEVPRSTSPSTSSHSTSFEDSEEIDQINESLKVLAETLIARLEERKIRSEERKRKLEDKEKYTIGECMKIMDEMEPKIADDAYIRVLKMLQEKEWRVTFLYIPDKLRREWISSI